MKTILNQKFNSFEELNKVSDKTPFSHKYIRFKLFEDKALKNKKGSHKYCVHVNYGAIAYILFIPYKNVLSKGWSYAPILGTDYKDAKTMASKNFVKNHLPKDWNGENGTFHLGQEFETKINA